MGPLTAFTSSCVEAQAFSPAMTRETRNLMFRTWSAASDNNYYDQESSQETEEIVR